MFRSGLILSRETLALAHAAGMVLIASWLTGGIGQRGEWIVAALAAPAFALLFLEARARRRAGDRAGLRRLLRWSAPLAALALLVFVAAANPSHRPAFIYDGWLLRPVPHVGWLPASVLPGDSLRILACFGGLFATGLNLAFCVHSRRRLRQLVLVLAVNTLGLSILGTLQGQLGADGPYFGLVAAANDRWFATFHYYNHWSAFAVLQCAAALGLVFHSLREPPDRGWLHGPGPLLALGALLIAATAPLSGSRSGTVLMLILALLAGTAALLPTARSGSRTRKRGPRFTRLVVVVGLLLVGAGLVWFQSGRIISGRAAQTLAQLNPAETAARGYGRTQLYADTWRMFTDAPVFGWGLEAYGPIFLRYSGARPDSNGVRNVYVDAHSDWLQSLAEIGLVGTLLLLALGLLPLLETWRGGRLPALPAWLLAGCALIAAYAWVEFPFACPAVVGGWWVLWFTALRTIQLGPGRAQPIG